MQYTFFKKLKHDQKKEFFKWLLLEKNNFYSGIATTKTIIVNTDLFVKVVENNKIVKYQFKL